MGDVTFVFLHVFCTRVSRIMRMLYFCSGQSFMLLHIVKSLRENTIKFKEFGQEYRIEQ